MTLSHVDLATLNFSRYEDFLEKMPVIEFSKNCPASTKRGFLAVFTIIHG
jgi:hypothetical protein